MTRKRTWYSADFKARAALEALRGELTTVQLEAKQNIHLRGDDQDDRQRQSG